MYQDSGGITAFPNPIIADLNGTFPAPFFQLNSAVPTDLYFIQAYDINGNFLFESDNYPQTTSGGGSDVTNYISFKNYII